MSGLKRIIEEEDNSKEKSVLMKSLIRKNFLRMRSVFDSKYSQQYCLKHTDQMNIKANKYRIKSTILDNFFFKFHIS